jgi:hypothetical protein
VGADFYRAVSGFFLGAAYAAVAGARSRKCAGITQLIVMDSFGASVILLSGVIRGNIRCPWMLSIVDGLLETRQFRCPGPQAVFDSKGLEPLEATIRAFENIRIQSSAQPAGDPCPYPQFESHIPDLPSEE